MGDGLKLSVPVREDARWLLTRVVPFALAYALLTARGPEYDSLSLRFLNPNDWNSLATCIWPCEAGFVMLSALFFWLARRRFPDRGGVAVAVTLVLALAVAGDIVLSVWGPFFAGFTVWEWPAALLLFIGPLGITAAYAALTPRPSLVRILAVAAMSTLAGLAVFEAISTALGAPTD